MTAWIHRLRPAAWKAEVRLRDAARALSRMPAGMATAIDVVGLDEELHALALAVERVAMEFGLVAVIELEPIVVVRLEREASQFS